MISERFIAWEPGRRMAFYFESTNIPVFDAFCEEWTLEPRGDTCHIVWRYAFESPPRLRFLQRGIGRAFAAATRPALRNLSTWLDEHGHRYEEASR